MDPGGGTASAGSSKAYIPQAQPTADRGYQNLAGSMYTQGQSALDALGTQSPAERAFPYVQDSALRVLFNPYQDQFTQGGQNAYDYFTGGVMPNINQGAQQLAGLGNRAALAAQNPAYGQAAGVGSNLSGGIQSGVQQLLGDIFNPVYGNAIHAGQQAAQRQFGAGDAIRAAAFDPQQALYDRTYSRLSDQIGAGNANSGLAGTPYGESVRGNALGNFNIDWQNNLLQRMLQGGQAAGALDTAGINQMLNPSLSASGAAQADLGAAGSGLTAALQGILNPANQQVNALGVATNAAQGGFGGANSLLSAGASGLNSYAGLPYGNYNQIQQQDLGALQNYISLGNQNYALPQQVINDLQSYLGLGQSASGLANTIGTTNFNQLAQGVSGAGQLLGGVNSLFGGGGGSGGLFSAGGLLGSQGPLFGTAADASIAAGGAPLALDAAGGGGFLDFLAPAALSA